MNAEDRLNTKTERTKEELVLPGPLLTLLSLTGGLYANVGALPAYISWIQYLSWFRYNGHTSHMLFFLIARYGFEALTINQWTRVNGVNETVWGERARDEVRKH